MSQYENKSALEILKSRGELLRADLFDTNAGVVKKLVEMAMELALKACGDARIPSLRP